MRGEIDNRTFFAGAETQVLPSEKRFLLGRVAIIDRVACLDCGDCDRHAASAQLNREKTMPTKHLRVTGLFTKNA